MNRCVTVILAFLLMQGATTAYAGDVVPYWKNANLNAIPPSTSSKASLSGFSLSINKFF